MESEDNRSETAFRRLSLKYVQEILDRHNIVYATQTYSLDMRSNTKLPLYYINILSLNIESLEIHTYNCGIIRIIDRHSCDLNIEDPEVDTKLINFLKEKLK